MKKTMILLFLACMLVVSGCSANSSNQNAGSNSNGNGTEAEGGNQAAGTDSVKIGYVINTLNNPFFVSVKDSAEKEAEEVGTKLSVVNANNDIATQLSGVEDLIQQGIDVLILDPVDSAGALPAIQAANDAGVKVITTGRMVEGAEIVTHLGYNEVKHGKEAGWFLAEALGGSGKIVELQGVMGTSTAQERSQGFQEAMADYPDIEILSSQSANFDRAEGLTVMENLLQAHSEIDGVYAANDEMALGALQAIEAANRNGIVIVGNDGTIDAFHAIQEGRIAGTMAIYPNQYGEKAIQIALQVANGENVKELIELPSIFVSEENVEEALSMQE
ncbi:D-ribose ABC transporter substrate-binding protein [Xylanibacillus composti]|uniref:D-ribose ABC transporter substrate-binding protein n=1 Tax=Xylanibacillus composti TaxID=1572762 RepID=A0A8J4H3S2_9BACL|nr:substrate-binding domain-containing protein [Xylanibacillus composti]MDT9726533.1 D-ribose ABC transporter substrate-binding protein [Xylanibacillus composti]GIQ68952.1 D-ribose ABC transporter substrate-binding protein [Xylanibacillus composti]